MASGNVFVFKSGSEEVTDGNFYAGIGLAVPVHAQHQLAQMERAGRIDGEPDMPDGTGALNVREGDGGPGFHLNPIGIAASRVGAGSAAGNGIAEIGESV
jgi:hypothetical protein